MSRLIEHTWKVLLLIALLVPVIAWTGCSGDDDDDEAGPSASNYAGTFMSSTDSGSFSFSFGAGGSISSDFGMTGGDAGLTATILSANLGQLFVSGTWGDEFNLLRLEGDDPSVQILGSFEDGIFVGFTAGLLGSGLARAIPDDGNSAGAYCGTFTRSSGVAGGKINLIIGSGIAQVTLYDQANTESSSFGGSVVGAAINLSDGEGLTAVGTIAGSTVSGTWSVGEDDGGDWSVSSAACGSS